MIQGQWFSPGKDISPLLPVRESVFGRGADALDGESWNTLVYEDDVPAASGRIWYRDGAYWLGDICVAESRRGRRLGDLVLRLLLFKAQSHAAPEVRLLCPSAVAGFFARLGFVSVSGPSGPDAETVEMAIDGARIDLDTCKHCPKSNCPDRR